MRTKSPDPLAYLARYAARPLAITEPPHPELGLVVVIPCHDEPDVVGVLDSLAACQPTRRPVEVIVVVNAALDAPARVQASNGETLRQLAEWQSGGANLAIRVHALGALDLPARHAGVGLARKLGMDEAALRLAGYHAGPHKPVRAGLMGKGEGDQKNPEALERGVIACLDADCTVSPNYLRALESHFEAHPRTPACSLVFEHPLDSEALLEAIPKKAGDPSPSGASLPNTQGANTQREGLIQYELHLRTAVRGLRLAGHPHAYHTVGSAMAVRASVYLAQGGMNRRKGAEDFHFLAKLMPLGGFTELTAATVYAQPRISHRVPFGTGRALGDWAAEQPGVRLSYDVTAYRALEGLLQKADALWAMPPDGLDAWLADIPPVMAGFLAEAGFAEALMGMRNNSASPGAFLTRFYRWMDRFRVLKFLHHARATSSIGTPDKPVLEVARGLLVWQGSHTHAEAAVMGGEELLIKFRELDKVPAE